MATLSKNSLPTMVPMNSYQVIENLQDS